MSGRRPGFEGFRILVVEDEYYLADDLASAFARRGALVLGPVGTVERAVRLIEAHDRIDGAVLDINLRGEPAFAVSELLLQRDVPFVFATGYGDGFFPKALAKVPRWEKPIDCEQLVSAVEALFCRGN